MLCPMVKPTSKCLLVRQAVQRSQQTLVFGFHQNGFHLLDFGPQEKQIFGTSLGTSLTHLELMIQKDLLRMNNIFGV
jgi:hypothetical protein